MFRGHLRTAIFGLLVVAWAYQIAHADAGRLHSLAQKVKCDCGCGDVLAECGHVECTRRPMLKKEISDAALHGGTDDQILQQLAAVHGTAVLVTPMFRGFDMMLWIVPILLAISVVGGILYRFRKVGQTEIDR